jgi:hypothetical protein
MNNQYVFTNAELKEIVHRKYKIVHIYFTHSSPFFARFRYLCGRFKTPYVRTIKGNKK